jgi:hypothetical protein
MGVDNIADTFEDNWQRRDDASPKPGGSRIRAGNFDTTRKPDTNTTRN